MYSMPAPTDVLDPANQALASKMAMHSPSLTMVPSFWESYSGPSFSWSCVGFTKANAKQVPNDKSGIYAFIIRPAVAGLNVGYLMYIGKAEEQSLRARFYQYFQEVKKPKGRPKIKMLISQWANHLDFCYVEVDKTEIDSTENVLLNAFVPHCNDEFDAELSPAIKAFASMK